jgi:hypothetical protein
MELGGERIGEMAGNWGTRIRIPTTDWVPQFHTKTGTKFSARFAGSCFEIYITGDATVGSGIIGSFMTDEALVGSKIL